MLNKLYLVSRVVVPREFQDIHRYPAKYDRGISYFFYSFNLLAIIKLAKNELHKRSHIGTLYENNTNCRK